MLRIILQYVLPLLLPFLLYAGYMTLTRGRTPDWLATAPWPALLASGVALLVLSLIVWSSLVGSSPGERYVPARIEDGQIVPGTTVGAPDGGGRGRAPDG